MSKTTPGSQGAKPGTNEIELRESVAGEEDPGASVDMGSANEAPGRAASGGNRSAAANPPMSPGDQAPPGTPGTGEDVCPDCGGSGKQDGRDCPTCQGKGTVIVGIGGA